MTDKYEFFFELHPPKILIRRDGPQTLPPLSNIIAWQKWDPDTSTCQLTTGNETVTAETLSQKALDAMFFGS